MTKNKKYILAILVLIFALIGVFAYFNNNKTVTYQNSSNSTVKGTTSKPTPHQPSNNANTLPPSGSVTDNKGVIPQASQTPSNKWTTSSDGNIVLEYPYNGMMISKGQNISGTAKVKTVSFLLKDNSVGVIDQGAMSVVNGKFSGTLNFTPHSNGGELEVYTTNPSNGAEESVIDVNVSFSS